MIKTKNLIYAILGLLICKGVMAHSPYKHIEEFFVGKFPEKPKEIHIDYLDKKLNIMCDNPELALTTENKLWGNVTLLVKCGTNKQFIQLNVKVIGHYVAASRPIPAGTVFTENDIHYKTDRLDTLKGAILMDKTKVIDHVALSNIPENQPIKRLMIRPKWHIRAGEVTRVIMRGEGYQIITNGKSLANASLNEHINVKIQSSGKIINGVVTPEGVLFFNKN